MRLHTIGTSSKRDLKLFFGKIHAKRFGPMWWLVST